MHHHNQGREEPWLFAVCCFGFSFVYETSQDMPTTIHYDQSQGPIDRCLVTLSYSICGQPTGIFEVVYPRGAEDSIYFYQNSDCQLVYLCWVTL